MPGPNTHLRSKRERVPLTQAELAERVGVAEITVGRWEAGLRPQPAHIRSLCAVLGASLAELGYGPEDDAGSTRITLHAFEGATRRPRHAEVP